mgnify:CR=1 FL=1
MKQFDYLMTQVWRCVRMACEGKDTTDDFAVLKKWLDKDGTDYCDFMLQNRLDELDECIGMLTPVQTPQGQEVLDVCRSLRATWKASQEDCPVEQLETIYAIESEDFCNGTYGKWVGRVMMKRMQKFFIRRRQTPDGHIYLSFNDLCDFYDLLRRAEYQTEFGMILRRDGAEMPYQIARRARQFRWSRYHDNVVEWRFIVMIERMWEIIRQCRPCVLDDVGDGDRIQFLARLDEQEQLVVEHVDNAGTVGRDNTYFVELVNEAAVKQAIERAASAKVGDQPLIRYKYQWRALYDVLNQRTVQARPWIKRPNSELKDFCRQMSEWFPSLQLTYKSLSHGGGMRGDEYYDRVFRYFDNLFKSATYLHR